MTTGTDQDETGPAHLDGKLWWTVVGAFVVVATAALMAGITPPLTDDPDGGVEPDCSTLIISEGENGSEMRTTEANIEACETKSGNLSLSGLNSSYRVAPDS